MPFKDTPAQTLAFARVRAASSRYAVNLRKVGRHVGELVKAFDAASEIDRAHLAQALRQYAKAIEPWAERTAAKHIQEIGRRDSRAWMAYSRKMGKLLAQQLAEAPLGHAVQASLARQVELITSLPTQAASQVHEYAVAAQAGGIRYTDMIEKIMALGDVTQARATLIARTETSRVASEITQSRAQSVGSTQYIWRGVMDRRERETHRKMQGRVCEWASPPEVEPGKFYHAGCIYNCRCFPEPIVPQIWEGDGNS
jgi:SPP1 gp7 family putative phage head morphogenesis protein